MYLQNSDYQSNLNLAVSNIKSIVRVINKQPAIHDKIPHVLIYFNLITSDEYFNLVQHGIINNISLASHFAKFNVNFVNQLYKQILLTDYFNRQDTLLSMVQFSDYLTHITDLYGVSIFNLEEGKTP